MVKQINSAPSPLKPKKTGLPRPKEDPSVSTQVLQAVLNTSRTGRRCWRTSVEIRTEGLTDVSDGLLRLLGVIGNGTRRLCFFYRANILDQRVK